jgi:hypothetical protein
VAQASAPLDEVTAAALRRRCQHRARTLRWARAIEDWSRRCWAPLSLVLIALVAVKTAGAFHQTFWSAVPATMAACAVASWLARSRFAVAPWALSAYLDRRTNARGLVMYAVSQEPPPKPETNAKPADHPALRAAFPPLWSWGTPVGWVVLTIGYALLHVVPEPAQAEVRPQAASAPIERVNRMLDALPDADPATRDFARSAREALRKMAERPEGLGREDFDALKRMEDRARIEIEERADRLAAADAALGRLDAALDQRGASGNPGTSKADLAALDRLAAEEGPQAELLRQVLEAAKRSSGRGSSGGNKGPESLSGGFDEASVERLREQIGEVREMIAAAQGEATEQGGQPGGIGRGAGVAPLELSHDTKRESGTKFDSKLFRVRPDDSSVVLGRGFVRQGEPASEDAQGLSTRTFEAGTSARSWQKRARPQQRPVLEAYFGEAQ